MWSTLPQQLTQKAVRVFCEINCSSRCSAVTQLHGSGSWTSQRTPSGWVDVKRMNRHESMAAVHSCWGPWFVQSSRPHGLLSLNDRQHCLPKWLHQSHQTCIAPKEYFIFWIWFPITRTHLWYAVFLWVWVYLYYSLKRAWSRLSQGGLHTAACTCLWTGMRCLANWWPKVATSPFQIMMDWISFWECFSPWSSRKVHQRGGVSYCYTNNIIVVLGLLRCGQHRTAPRCLSFCHSSAQPVCSLKDVEAQRSIQWETQLYRCGSFQLPHL